MSLYPTLNNAGTSDNQFQYRDGKVLEIKQVVVHRFRLSDVDDPDLYAAEPILNWQNSELGKWVLAHSTEQPIWHRQIDYSSYGYEYAITAKLYTKDLTFFLLKWDQAVDKYR
jgi:hypothetical protein